MFNNSSWEANVDGNSTDQQYRSGISLPTPIFSSLPLDTSKSSGQNISPSFNNEVHLLIVLGTENRFTEDFLSILPSQASDHSYDDIAWPASALSVQDQDIVRLYFQQVFQSQSPFLDEVTAGKTTSQLSELTARSLTCLASVGCQGLNHKRSTLGRLGLSMRPEITKQAELYGETVHKCLDAFVKGCNSNVTQMDRENQELSFLEVQMCVAQIIYSKVRL
jgi:hypothetical protein